MGAKRQAHRVWGVSIASVNRFYHFHALDDPSEGNDVEFVELRVVLQVDKELSCSRVGSRKAWSKSEVGSNVSHNG